MLINCYKKVVAVETRLKESCDTHRYHRPNVNVIVRYFDSSDDEECNVAKVV
jgi:hypothetical protein